MSIYGKYNEDGTVTEPTECILTGRSLVVQPHKPPVTTVREKVTGTPYFYRVIGHQYHRVTDDLRATWRAGIPSETEPAPEAAAESDGTPLVIHVDEAASITMDEAAAPKRRRTNTEGEN